MISTSSHLVDWYIDIYTNLYGTDNSYTDIMLKFNDYLKTMVNTSSKYKTLSSMILSIGVALLLLHFFTDLSEKASMKQLSMLQFGKTVCAAIATVFVMFYSKQIFIFLLTMVEKINDMTVTKTGFETVSKFLSNDIVYTLMQRAVNKDFTIWKLLGYTLTAVLLELVSLVTRLLITYYSATRVIQLFVYLLFMPIGVSDIFENGPGGMVNLRSPGFRYIKNMVAIMMQIIVITVICQSFSLITNTINTYYYEQSEGTSIETSSNGLISKANLLNTALYPLRNLYYTESDGDYTTTYAASKDSNLIKESLANLEADEENDAYTGTGTTEKDEKDAENEKTKENKKTWKERLAEFLTTDPNKPDGEPSDGLSEGYIVSFSITGTSDASASSSTTNYYEVKKITRVVNTSGNIVDEEEAEKIKSSESYVMTVASVEQFFKYCTGDAGGKFLLFITIMIVKILMIVSASKLCNTILGTEI